MQFKLNPREQHPANNTLVMVLGNAEGNIGFMSIAIFKDSKWFTMPNMQEYKRDFFWVEFE